MSDLKKIDGIDNLLFRLYIKPFTPLRPTHNFDNTFLLKTAIERVESNSFFNARNVTIFSQDSLSTNAIASRFNGYWYTVDGLIEQ